MLSAKFATFPLIDCVLQGNEHDIRCWV